MSGMKSTLLLLCALLACLSVSKSGGKILAAPSNGDLRFAGYGATTLWGRVEIYLNDKWGTICDSGFGIKGAEVACRQMGLGYAVNYRATPFQRHGLANSVVHMLLSCDGTETHLLNCNQFRVVNTSCSHANDIEIICSDWKPWPYSGEIRLVGGTSASEGYVEMYLNGEWGRVCSDSMSSDEADVICRQLGYDSAVSYTPNDGDELGSGGYPILNISRPMVTGNTTWYNDVVNCLGNEVCLARCLSFIPTSAVDQCSNEVGVRCTHSAFQNINVGNKSVCEVNSTIREKSLRLVGGSQPYIGRLEVFHNNRWGVICVDRFGAAEGHLACKQLGYSVILSYANTILNDNPVVHYYSVDCRGAESDFAECKFVDLPTPTTRCARGRFASIHCHNSPYPPLASVRMLGGSGPYGVIEVFNGGRWGPICDEYFDQADGDVVCRQLGYTGALRVIHNSYLGVGRNFLHMTNVHCTGNETHLWTCPFTNATEVKCNYYNQVAVHCGSNSSMIYGMLRLTGGDDSSGRLEINFDGRWGTVCSRNFAAIDGHVACRQIGFKGVISISNVTNAWTDTANHTILLNEVHCKGYEEKLMDCRHKYGDNVCTYDEDVLLSCDAGPPEPDGKLRLAGDISPNKGRLEILKDGLWGTVCSFHFDKTDADVACRQMGFRYAVKILENLGGGSGQPINIHNVTCIGNESSLMDCEHEVYTYFYCDHSENVGLLCDALPSNGDLRLAGYGATPLWGRVEIYFNGTWGTICDDTFRLKEADVACRQMGLGYAVNYRRYPFQRHGLANSAVHFSLSCIGNESHILNCEQRPIINGSCTHQNDIEIICSDWKPQPYSGEIRLVGGTTVSEGLVQMYLNGEWGRVCSDNNITSDEANVICRQLGYDSAVSYQPRDEDINESGYVTLDISSYGETANTIWFNSSLSCTGNEVCLTSCLSSIPTRPLTNCSNEVGVRCTHSAYQNVNVGSKLVCEVNSKIPDKAIRLVVTDQPHMGAIEVFYNNSWGGICYDNFFAAEGHVACRDLGYSVIVRYAPVRINGSLLHFYEVNCDGTERSFRDCEFVEQTNQSCRFGLLAGVQCIDRPYPPLASVRMLGGSGPFGVVEMFHGNRWGPICDGDFDQEDGDVFCRQLGYTGALQVIPNSYLGVARNPIRITHIECTGDEEYLWDCDFDNIDNNTEFVCDYYNQVAVHCGSNSSMMYGALRLTGGNSSFGRLEINLDDSWGSVCAFRFDSLDGHVACRQLGFKGVNSITVNGSWANRTNDTVFLTSVQCQGYEDQLIHCRHEFGENVCTDNLNVMLYCDEGVPEMDGQLRLVGNISPTSGRLEILKDGLWGTVCSYHFDMADANVTCRQLGYTGPAHILRNYGGGSDRPINIHEINCNGSEDRLIDCEFHVYTHFYCHHSENVAIACDVPALTRGMATNGDMRLAGDGSTSMVGRLEMYRHGEWGTVCGRKFGMQEAHVACRQLGLGYAASYSFNQRYGWSDGPVNLEVRSCIGNESFLFNCNHRLNPSGCSHVHDVNLVCTNWPSSLRNGKVRLTGGQTSSEGYVEVYGGNNSWYRICGDFGLKEGNAACKQLGYTGIRASVYATFEGDSDMLSVRSSCEVNETKGFCLGSTSSCFSVNTSCEPSDRAVFIKCVQGRAPSEEVIPQCTEAMSYEDDLRLYNGTDSSGMLQIYREDEWGILCGDQFTGIEGEIACRQLGFSSMAHKNLSQWSDPNVLEPDTFNISSCSGFENKLSECVWSRSDVSLSCMSGVVNLECSNRRPPINSARLSGGAGPYGTIQRYTGHQWKAFCGTDENVDKTLQYYYEEMGYVNISTLISGPRCSSDERRLQKCLASNGTQQTCGIKTETVIYAQLNISEDIKEGSVMLSNGNYTAGVLQVFYNGSWIDVCSSMDAGHVACRQLGFYSILGVFDDLTAIELGKGKKQSDDPMAKYSCAGTEQNLNDCSLDVDDNVCQPPASSIIACNFENGKVDGHIRLTDGGSNYGRLEIAVDGYWGTVCSTNFDKAAADVACKQLGFNNSVTITRNFGGGKFLPVFVNGTNCTGDERRLADCSSISNLVTSCNYTQNVAVACNVSCQPLPDINNGSATCSLGDNGVPSFNDTCDVICNAGYLLRGNPTRTCLSDGSWSGTDDECIETNCQPLDDIINGSIACSLTPSNENICNITCNKGYVLIGSDTRTCLINGSWSGTDSSCQLVNCQPPPVVTNGRVDCSKGVDGISHFEDSCRITCNTGYTMTDGTSATGMCLSNGTWSSMDGECRRVKCQELSKFDNGNINCSLGDDGMYSYEDTCSVTCNSGFTLSGSDTRVCLSNGSWSDMDSACDRVKCPIFSTIDDGVVVCDFGDDGVYSYEDTCNVTCNSGYTLTGSDTKMCLSNGSWSGTESSCERVNCQEIPEVDNGNVTCSIGNDGVYSYEDTCDVLCNVGYTLVGSGTKMCLSNGSWSGMDSVCDRVKCQELPKFDNGNVTCSLGDDAVYSYEDTCTVTCNSGYILTGSNTKMCLSNGSWSSMDTVCGRVKCQELLKFDNGNVTCSLGDDGIYSYEDTCTVTCNSGYTLTGSDTKMCLSNGSWSSMDTVCGRVKCQELPKFDNGNVTCSLGVDAVYSYEDTCTVTCNSGYTLTGSDTKMCLSNGSWSSMDTVCGRVKCQELLKFDNGNVTCYLGDDAVYSYEDTCTVTCNSGYTLTGSDTKMCLSNGSWSSMDTVCGRVKCQDLPKFDNGNVTCSLGDDAVYSYEDTCTVTCNSGYTLTGSDTKMCLSNGSWSSMDTVCERVKCQELLKFDNGNVTCSVGDDGISSYEDTCTVTCNSGYTLTGSDTKMCLSNGSWSSMDTVCERVKCQELPELDNANVICSLGDDGIYSYEDTCTVTCNSGYTLTGNDTKMCLSDGSWSGMDAVCGRDNNRISTTTFSTTTIPSMTSLPSITFIPTANANTKSNDNNNVGAAVGIVVGILCVLVLIVIVVVVIYFVKRWYDRNRVAHHKFRDDDDGADLVKSSEGPGIDNPTYENPGYEMD